MLDQDAAQSWTADELLELGRSYQAAAVFAAAADLDLFALLTQAPLPAREVAARLACEPRGVIVLLDALTALGLLEKTEAGYLLWPGAEEFLTPEGRHSILAMTQHQANCLRRWAQLARVIKQGRPVDPAPSVRGPQGDAEAFIGAMHNISAPAADEVIRGLESLQFTRLLDVGGASGTWTMAFLRACPGAQATLFDLPEVIPLARQRLAAAGLAARVTLVSGDFMKDALPGDSDLAWVSAIVHQNSRAQNRALFASVFQALRPGGRIALRDILMEESRTVPLAGALFAVNMLVATEGGGTFTFAELGEDLAAAGFVQAAVARRDPAMNSIVVACKPPVR
jgi:predicted O-methyltransferase YrrM